MHIQWVRIGSGGDRSRGGPRCRSAYAQDAKAAEVLAKTRKALGDKKLEALKTLSLQARWSGTSAACR